MKVLLVEDEKRISDFAAKGLREAGFTVEVCDNGDEALTRALFQQYDAMVLDIMLPGRDGLSVLRQLREKRNATPVLLLTARTALDERVEGLNLGADDYLTKPFYVEELIARIRAVARRNTGEKLTVLKAGNVTVNLVTREVFNGEAAVRLTTREFSLLEYLLRSPGRVLTRTQILEHVWGYDFDPSTNLIDVHIQRLRKKLGGDGQEPLIETVRGVGYRVRKEQA
ncbi:MAG: response regulator transcription factor [Candidatus Hydrogenedentes bacterium]|nr:response regulator transcription factor [Candidatus Hydrogenedentota bacterium]MBI3118661.1 response regulator transcription factor [Candidatus Hydrogenedentota bacterium]